jgi:hypothetical protein
MYLYHIILVAINICGIDCKKKLSNLNSPSTTTRSSQRSEPSNPSPAQLDISPPSTCFPFLFTPGPDPFPSSGCPRARALPYPRAKSNPKFSPVVHHRCAQELLPCRSSAPPPAPLHIQPLHLLHRRRYRLPPCTTSSRASTASLGH